MPTHDLIVIGGGIVGLSAAYRFGERFPDRSCLVLEKEQDLAEHQTGRNSGVLHSGIYYKPGSLKAHNCREGKRAMEDFCLAEGVPFEICGKVIVATSEEELPRLADILQRGQANGVRCEMIEAARLANWSRTLRGSRRFMCPRRALSILSRFAGAWSTAFAARAGRSCSGRG